MKKERHVTIEASYASIDRPTIVSATDLMTTLVSVRNSFLSLISLSYTQIRYWWREQNIIISIPIGENRLGQ